ncbi:MAG: DUF3365 domain-containing protein [Bdellovibrionales bacterium]|nr:DUF3365 domain-containing protein [Bdellovibrionales bacterium]
MIAALVMIICSFISISGFLYFNKKELHKGIIEKSRAIHLRLDAATNFVATQDGLMPVIDRMKKKYTSGQEMSKEDKEIVLKQVPIVAAMKIGAKDADKDDYEFRVFSDEPRNLGNEATSVEKVVFNKFNQDENLKEYIDDNEEFITVYRPVRLKKEIGCFTCHGDPKDSPWQNGRDILGYKMENWNDGKLHGVFAIKTDLKKIAALKSNDSFLSPANILIFSIISGGIVGVILITLMINKPVKIINDIVQGLNKTSEQVSSAAIQIAAASSELSSASNAQASSLQETSAAIEEINSMIHSNTENAKQSTITSDSSMRNAEKGQKVVTQMIEAIDNINTSNNEIMNQINETNKDIESIVTIINEIGAKTKIINDIVFQTKLLSFNASVEAARAGEQGKGFSVVAEEVGNLASMSGNAAMEITKMLESSITNVEEIVKNSKDKIGKLIHQGKQNIDIGTKVSRECGGVLEEIVTSVGIVSKTVTDIASAGQEQADGVQEITKAVAELDQVTQQNTASSVESANAANSLSGQAEYLKELVQQLVLTIDGKNKS